MTTRKNYNSIVFLTTLSVYLGLVLVGAPPCVLAQQNKIVSRQTNAVTDKSKSQNKAEKNTCSELGIAEIIKLLAKYDANSAPFNFSYQVDYLEQQPANLRVVLDEGDKLFVDSFRGVITCNLKLQREVLENDKTQDQSTKEFRTALLKALFPFTNAFYSYKANSQEISFDSTLTFANNETAKSFADFNKSVLEHAHKIEIESPQLAAENKLESAILNNTTFSLADNQVFIVTRLPRGSLDALIAKDAQ